MICRYDLKILLRGHGMADDCDGRHISKLHLLVLASVFPYRMANWLRGRGRVFGFWNFGMGSRGGKLWLRFRGRRCESALH